MESVTIKPSVATNPLSSSNCIQFVQLNRQEVKIGRVHKLLESIF
jgi:hypothetical protein